MKFNIDDYKGKYVMHCKTEEEAKDFCKRLDSLGRRWINKESYLNKTQWQVCKSETCYCFNVGTFSNINYFKENMYIILEWSDFMEKKFTKSDLKNGDVILRRNGNVVIVCLETGTLIEENGFNYLSNVNEDLTYIKDGYGRNFDIIAVRRPKKPYDCQFAAFDKGLGELVYERKDEPEEMTLKEVCEALGKDIKIVKEH